MSVRRALVSTSLAAALCLVLPASADAQSQPPQAQPIRDSGPEKVHREGEYGGVNPDAERDEEYTPPTRQRRRYCRGRRGRNRVTWVGFRQLENGGARLFVQSCGDVTVNQEIVGDELYVHLPGARYVSRNTRRRMDMRYFDTIIARVLNRRPKAKRRSRARRGIHLTVTFRNPADVQEGQQSRGEAGDGFQYTYIDFPPPSGELPDPGPVKPPPGYRK